MYSLKNKITRNLTINMVIVMSVLLIVMYFFMQQLLRNYVLTRLVSDAESLISAIEQDPDQRWQVMPGRMSAVYDRVRSGHYYQVSVDGQDLVSRSLFDTEIPSTAGDASFSGHFLTPGPGSETWLVWVQQVRKNRQVIDIWVVEDIAPIQQQLRQYTFYALALVLLVTAILIYLQQRILGQSFYIFTWLRENLPSIRHRKAQQSGLQIPLEITPLVAEIEKLVDHLRNRIERTRHTIGNLAHELKRPLQLLSIQQENENNSALAEPLAEIKRILERELKRAKISGSAKAGGDFIIADEMRFMIAVMEKIYPHIQVELACQHLAEPLELDRDDMLELTGNLLDNACKFASRKAVLGIKVSARKLTLIFEDDGKGLDIQQVEEITQRGVRLDETVAGHGLGLGICNDIIDTYQGSISFSESALGGLKVTVEIPLHQVDAQYPEP
ncbi:sensor histidine kinase [Gammaproteobacteria bacterium]|nr:sensor histidine kinase [Gammaproteobacteria bacterium]